MLLLAALPAYLIRFSVAGIPSTLLEMMILIAFAAWVSKNYRGIIGNIKNRINSKFRNQNSKLLVRYPFDIEIILLLLIAFVSAGVAGFSNEALGIFKAYFFEPVLVYLLVMNVLYCPRIYKSDTNLQITNDVLSLRGPASWRGRSNPEVGATDTGLPRPFGARNDMGKIIWPLAISALVVGLWAVVEKLTGVFAVEAFWPRVTGPYPYPNALGLYLGPLALILVGWLLYTFKISNFKFLISKQFLISKFLIFKTIFVLLAIIISLLAIFFARSEGAAIGIVAALFGCGILAGGRLRWATLAVALIAGAGIMAYAPTRTYAIEKIALRDLSGEIRKQQWRETWAMMTESPKRFIFGTGLSGYQAAVAPYHQEGIFFNFGREPREDFHRQTVFNEEYRAAHWQPVEIYMYPHNIFLNFWTELGLAGLVLFIWIIGKFFYTEIKVMKSRVISYWLLVIGLFGAMIVIIVHGLVDVPFFKNDLAALFWIILAMAGIMNLKIRSLPAEPAGKKLEIK